jgi:hypothetical protein
MRCLTWIAIILGSVIINTIAIYIVSAQPPPPPKVGQCPSGYRESGGYCAPTSDRAPDAVPKRGQCPSGWTQSGDTASRCGGAELQFMFAEGHR